MAAVILEPKKIKSVTVMAAVILEPKKIKSVTVSIVSPVFVFAMK